VAKKVIDEIHPLIPRSQITTGPASSFRTVQVITNCNLSIMHAKMSEMAEKYAMDAEKLPKGHCVVFVNRRADYVKLLVGTDSPWPVVAAYRLPPRQKFSLEAVADIAMAFRSTCRIDANTVLNQAMTKYFGRMEQAA